MAGISVQGACWRPGGTPVLERFSIALKSGSRVAIVGRSGCGKSSLLRILAGVRTLDSGSISGVPENRAFVFQDPALLPWLSVEKNVLLPLSLQGRSGNCAEILSAVGLPEHRDKLPGQLSGGQRMRASLARALISQPDILFLDEPFAALDGRTRREMHQLVLDHTPGKTVILVTHDLSDAARLADRVLVVDGPPLSVLVDLPVSGAYPRTPDEVAEVVRVVERASK